MKTSQKRIYIHLYAMEKVNNQPQFSMIFLQIANSQLEVNESKTT